MDSSDLVSVAEAMVAEGKGLLAIDESSGTIKKRSRSTKRLWKLTAATVPSEPMPS